MDVVKNWVKSTCLEQQTPLKTLFPHQFCYFWRAYSAGSKCCRGLEAVSRRSASDKNYFLKTVNIIPKLVSFVGVILKGLA